MVIHSALHSAEAVKRVLLRIKTPPFLRRKRRLIVRIVSRTRKYLLKMKCVYLETGPKLNLLAKHSTLVLSLTAMKRMTLQSLPRQSWCLTTAEVLDRARRERTQSQSKIESLRPRNPNMRDVAVLLNWLSMRMSYREWRKQLHSLFVLVRIQVNMRHFPDLDCLCNPINSDLMQIRWTLTMILLIHPYGSTPTTRGKHRDMHQEHLPRSHLRQSRSRKF